MWVVNYAAPGMAIAGLGMTYYALMKQELNLERQNQDYTSYVLDIMKKGEDKNNNPGLRSSHSVIAVKTCLREPRPVMLRSKSANGKRFPLKATASLASSEKMLRKMSRCRKANKMSTSYTYLKLKFDEIREQANKDGLNVAMLPATNPQSSDGGGGNIPSLENVISRASLAGPSPMSSMSSMSVVTLTPGLTHNPICDSHPTVIESVDMQTPSAISHTHTILEGLRKEQDHSERIAESPTCKLSPINEDLPDHSCQSVCSINYCKEEKCSDENVIITTMSTNPRLQIVHSDSSIDVDEESYSIDESRSGSAITVIHASSSMILSKKNSKIRLDSESSIQTVFRSNVKDKGNICRRSRSVCQLNRSYDNLISQRCGGDMNRLDMEIFKGFSEYGQTSLSRTLSSPELEIDLNLTPKLDYKLEDSTQFLMPPTAKVTDSIVSNCIENPRTASISDTTLLPRHVSKSCNYLKIHELAVEEILKEKQELGSHSVVVRTQSLPDVLLKDGRYGLNGSEFIPSSPNLKLTSLQIALRNLNEKFPINLIISVIFVLFLWSFFDFLADQSPRKVKFSWHW